MNNILRFFIYAIKFEIAYRNNNWDAVKKCFLENAYYTVEADNPFGGAFRGNENIIDAFIKSITAFDKKFSSRMPMLTRFPRYKDDTVFIDWKVKYLLKEEPPFYMTGSSEVKFEMGKIAYQIDRMPTDDCKKGEIYYRKFNPLPIN